MQTLPERLGRAIRVIGDRVGPIQRGALASRESVEIDDFRITHEIPKAQFFDPLVDDAALEHVVTDVSPAVERAGCERADLVGGSGYTLHQRSTGEPGSPAPGSAGSSPWPTPHVLMTRCWPNVSATNEPSSTICA